MPIQSAVRQLHPSAKFFLLLGLFLFCLSISSLMQMLIILPYADLKSISDLAKLEDFSNPNLLKGLKIAQAVSVLFSFIIPSLLFAYMAAPSRNGEGNIAAPFQSPFRDLGLLTGFKMISGIYVVILVFAVMPFINWAGELNSHLTLPDFMSGLENWMKSSEESLKKLTEAFLRMNGIGDLILNIIVIALLAALGEELLFRGCMQNVLIEWMNNRKADIPLNPPSKSGTHAAVWITAILFSALHAQFYGFLPRMLLGVVLGYLYVWSGSLWLSILFHFMNNGLAVLVAFLIDKGAISETAETVGAGETPVYFVLVSAAVSVGLMYFVHTHRIKPEITSTEVP